MTVPILKDLSIVTVLPTGPPVAEMVKGVRCSGLRLANKTEPEEPATEMILYTYIYTCVTCCFPWMQSIVGMLTVINDISKECSTHTDIPLHQNRIMPYTVAEECFHYNQHETNTL